MSSPLEINKKEKIIGTISQILGETNQIDVNLFYQEVEKSIQSDISTGEIFKLVLLSVTSLLEKDPAYDKLAMEKGVLDKRLQEFDLPELAINEKDKNQKALDFYNLISSLRFVPSTPTLFHAGLDKANLLKYSGGVATDWTNLRALGSSIKSIDSESTGLIPFLKLANDTTGAINRSGRRRGASVAYLEDHVGVVHCSNLCTEITLNTSEKETAVCNLGSVNLARHIRERELDNNLLQETINIAIRMLDNVIDLNYYPTKEAEYSNFQHRPIGLGMMGFQDALFQLNINYGSSATLEFTDQLTEKFSYYAISASCQLAQERGSYASYQGSNKLNWDSLKEQVKKYGMRNSNAMAIAPTATIANIAGCYPCIEAMYSNIYVESNVAGEFTIVNKYLVEDLKKLNL
ncbi:7996_t:CDS:2 [Ambispora leptoticha]|uniref:7996_t:CDS:1 n=1 Tax=Ambispora leptoticha TaxID=144679 RepID=A0A9N9BTM7_9GLOM|nr:7996_t:CDS:2 [Ambispora leptoticha]